MTHLKALGTRVIVERDAPDEITKGGVIIPAKAQRKPQLGTITAVPEGDNYIEFILKEFGSPVSLLGARVLFASYAGEDIELGEIIHTILDVKDILAIVFEDQVVVLKEAEPEEDPNDADPNTT